MAHRLRRLVDGGNSFLPPSKSECGRSIPYRPLSYPIACAVGVYGVFALSIAFLIRGTLAHERSRPVTRCLLE